MLSHVKKCYKIKFYLFNVRLYVNKYSLKQVIQMLALCQEKKEFS